MPSAAPAGAAHARAPLSRAIVSANRRATRIVFGGNTACGCELCFGYGQLDSRPIGALRRTRVTDSPANTLPVRRTSTHCTVVRRPGVNQTTRVGFVLERRACAVPDW